MTAYILPLDAPSVTLDLAGGKGLNLSRLLRAGFPVPPGFVISTAAYRAVVAAAGLEARLAEISRGTDRNAPASFETASAAIRALFDAAAVPDEIGAAIRAAYRDLAASQKPGAPAGQLEGPGAPAVAVRSSATAEDLPSASFAGQQETFLNVRGEADLLNAVKQCWSSLWTARALAYRARQNISPEAVSLAVVVQPLVPAQSAGVLFTINPVTGRADEMLVNAAWGLGEALVAGQVNPDAVTLDKATGHITRAEVADKQLMTVPATDGTAAASVGTEMRHLAVLSPAQAAELARLGRAIEAEFGAAQDIEWAIAGGQVHILQARPVTAAAAAIEQPVPGDDDWPPLSDWPPQPHDVWTQADVGERWPEAVTPLTWSTWCGLINANMRDSWRHLSAPYIQGIQWAKRAYGRIYFNEGAMAHVMSEEYGMPMSIVSDSMGGQGGPRAGWRWGTFLRRLPMMAGLSRKWRRNEKEYEALWPQIEAWVDDFMRRKLGAMTDSALWEEVGSVWMPRVMKGMAFHGEVTGQSLTSYPMVENLAERWLGRRDLASTAVSGVDVLAAEIVPWLHKLAQAARDLGLDSILVEMQPAAALREIRQRPEARLFLNLLDEFLQRHGHRCASEAEWLYPRWSEAPELVLESVADYVRLDEINSPDLDDTRQRRAEVVAEAEARLDPIRRSIFRSVVARTQQLVRLRDDGQHYLVKLALPVRHIYGVLGERWAARAWLEQPEDFFFLVVPEIEAVLAVGDPVAAGVDLGASVSARRRAYEHWLKFTAPEVLGADGRPLASSGPPPGAEGTLSGIAASGGRASGPARVIAHPRDASRLQPGDILVTRATDPGWTPVFSVVAGLVLEIGGQLSHGAIVAREYGLPAVVNVADATRRIRDGQHVTVDGTAGQVYLTKED